LLFAPIIAIAPAEASALSARLGGLSRQLLKPDFFVLVAFLDSLQDSLGLFAIAAGE
jgi:hypothetical protein